MFKLTLFAVMDNDNNNFDKNFFSCGVKAINAAASLVKYRAISSRVYHIKTAANSRMWEQS